jgi:hypothetical protein
MDEVDRLNNRVKNEISGRLYLFCNYNSDIITSISVDAKFKDGVLELYKILIDTNSILTKIKYIIFGDPYTTEWKDFTNRTGYYTLTNHLELINTLRSIYGHNNDERNGLLEQIQIDNHNNWLKGILGRDKPSTEEDFAKMLTALSTISRECSNSIDRIITYITESSEKELIARRWEDAILDWYNKKRDIFLGQLGSAWWSKKINESGNRYNMPIRKNELMYQLRVWIKNYYEQPYSDELNQLNKVKAEYMMKLSNPVDVQRFTEQMEITVTDCNTRHAAILTDIRRVCRKKDKESALQDQDYSDYFFAVSLSALIRDALRKYDCNLLPQDLMQLVIKDNFNKIRITQ